jgi:hypothetical protein
MKRVTLLVATLAAVAVPLVAQRPAHHAPHHGPGMNTAWRELNEFHSLLRTSHHPLMESGDLGPARSNAALLAKAADAWAASTAPAGCHAPVDIGDKVAALAADARIFADLVAKNGTDEEVKAALEKVHGQFQITHRACLPTGHHGRTPPSPAQP